MNLDEIRDNYEIRKLDKAEKIKSFNCGDSDLNDFILNESVLYRESLLAVSYIFEQKFSKKTIAYFSLCK